MTGAAWGNASRSTHRAVRDLVSLHLDSEGIASVAQGAQSVKLSDRLDPDDVLVPDLTLVGIDMKVSSRLRPFKLSEDVESVTRAAALRGVPIGVVAQWRSERGIDEAFVVTTLSHFSKLVRGDHLAST